MSSSKKNVTKKGNQSKHDSSNSTLERSSQDRGMNPIPILAGYGPRGERLRHTVHSGALKLPKDALDIHDSIMEETGLNPPETFLLPGLDAVLRPTMDPTLKTLIVTNIGLERVSIPDPSYQPIPVPPGYPQPQPNMISVMRPKVENQTIKRMTTTTTTQDTVVPPVDRIRGGGGDGGEDQDRMDVDPQSLTGPTTGQPALDPPLALATHPDHSGSIQGIPTGVPTPASQLVAYPTGPTTGSTDPRVIDLVKEESTFPVSTPHYAERTPSLQSVPPQSPYVLSSQPPVTPSAPILTPSLASSTTAVAPTVSAPVLPMSAPSTSNHPPRAMAENVTSSSTGGSNSKSPPPPAPAQIKPVQVLESKPEPRWEVHRPGPNDEMVTPEDQLTAKPSWLTKDGISEVERTMLPEWFDQSAKHRTPQSYMKARETILEMSSTLANRNVTNAMVRRSVVGDAGSLIRLRNFLTHWGLINEDAINDSAPTPTSLREKYPVPRQLSEQQRNDLVAAVVEQSTKRRRLNSDDNNSYSFVSLNWEEIAVKVGDGATPEDCERHFLSIPIHPDQEQQTERPITPEVSSVHGGGSSTSNLNAMRQEFIRELVDSCKPEVVRAVTTAALQVAGPKEAQSGTLLGLLSHKAVETAQNAEHQIEAVLVQLLDQRMKKLENRMGMMEDVESILEAEKMALELERRDLYTARCRHWFGGA